LGGARVRVRGLGRGEAGRWVGARARARVRVREEVGGLLGSIGVLFRNIMGCMGFVLWVRALAEFGKLGPKLKVFHKKESSPMLKFRIPAPFQPISKVLKGLITEGDP
jgi:hypothetical protein